MPQDVDDPRVAATRQHDEALVAHVDDHGLIVPDPGVGLPARVAAGELEREALLEVREPIDLARHQHRAVEEQRGTRVLDHLPTLAIEVLMARRRHPDLLAVGEHDLALPPGIGVEHERHTPPHAAVEALESAVVIGVPVGEDDAAELPRIDAEHVEIVRRRVLGQPRVVEERLAPAVAVHRQRQRVPVLGAQLVAV